MSEAGVKNFEVVGFYGILAPVATPKEVVAKPAQALKETLESREIRTRMIAQGADPAHLGPEAFAAVLKVENERWSKAVKAAVVKLD